mmetsp:Transcript_20186/g.29955  ORF Transcript_20186/g.29955 Transcript_20186/m.29955 type:complete len:270 (+) Transcript_20186:1027-1836(+)
MGSFRCSASLIASPERTKGSSHWPSILRMYCQTGLAKFSEPSTLKSLIFKHASRASRSTILNGTPRTCFRMTSTAAEKNTNSSSPPSMPTSIPLFGSVEIGPSRDSDQCRTLKGAVEYACAVASGPRSLSSTNLVDNQPNRAAAFLSPPTCSTTPSKGRAVGVAEDKPCTNDSCTARSEHHISSEVRSKHGAYDAIREYICSVYSIFLSATAGRLTISSSVSLAVSRRRDDIENTICNNPGFFGTGFPHRRTTDLAYATASGYRHILPR